MKKKEIKKQYTKEILQKLKANVKLEEVVEKDFFLKNLVKTILRLVLFAEQKKH